MNENELNKAGLEAAKHAWYNTKLPFAFDKMGEVNACMPNAIRAYLRHTPDIKRGDGWMPLPKTPLTTKGE